MPVTLVDTNILLDIVTNDVTWYSWSIARLEEASLVGEVGVTDVVYAELSTRYEQIDDLNALLDLAGIEVLHPERGALFLAAKAFQRYKGQGGTKTGVLPDFFIGAHAVFMGVPLLTRDGKRYRTYFPTLNLIAP
jgi:predicted nucleic acid-binding protein